MFISSVVVYNLRAPFSAPFIKFRTLAKQSLHKMSSSTQPHATKRAQFLKSVRWPAATIASPGQGHNETAATTGRARHSTLLERPVDADTSTASRPAGCLYQPPSTLVDSPREISSRRDAPLPAAACCGLRLAHASMYIATRKLAAGAMDDYLVERRMQTHMPRCTHPKLESAM